MLAPILVLGTRNRHKVIELTELLTPNLLQLQTLSDYPTSIDVIEDGDTFVANATKKAVQQAQHLDRWVLGEDSGLVVDALQGAPGVYSARYAGVPSNDEANNDKLLAELAGVSLSQRTAHYVCCSVLANPQGEVLATAEGRCHGRIIEERRGSHGFGYDPLFEIIELHQTFGELGPAVKAMLSHRGRALRQLLPQIERLIQAGIWKANAG
jgi:XTP/dITP diphosphohydrolase